MTTAQDPDKDLAKYEAWLKRTYPWFKNYLAPNYSGILNSSLPPDWQAAQERKPLTDEQIDAVAEAMPGGVAGFMKQWGYRQFAQEILAMRAMPTWEPQFDCMEPAQEDLARKFCAEIAGPRGKKGRPPDPVRLLEMAEALYKVERQASP